jgi:uncharacterized membrane protein YccC
MDAPRTQENPYTEPPRHLFFGAEDRRLGGRAGLTDKYLSMEKARRHQLAEHVINTANQLASAVRTLRAFDRTGNAEQVLDHIEATFEDLQKQTKNLIDEVSASVDRYGDALEQLAFQDAKDAMQSAPPAPAPVVHHLSSKAGPSPAPDNIATITPLAMVKSIEAALDHAGRNRAGR